MAEVRESPMKMFLTSDHHFFHWNILKFTGDDGERIRPTLPEDDLEAMHECMIEKWNSVVGPNDKVYHLGDIIMSTARRSFDQIMPRLNGVKILIKGNHDNAKLSVYADYFKDVRGEHHLKTKDKDMILMTHRPIFLGEHHFRKKSVFNVHGHIHQNVLQDPRYVNICVEHWDYTPVEWGVLLEHIGRMKERL